MRKVTNIIIGFGKGGKTLAKYLGQQGEEVLVIERSKQMYGGNCINIACLPSKRLITAANRGTDFTKAIQGKQQMVRQLRDKNYHLLADEKTITVLDGTARFTGNHTIAVETGDGQQEFRGERIFINTGAVPNLPPIPGLLESPALVTSTTAMELTRLPEELVIIGAGYIGLEFASMFAHFGAHVTVLDQHTDFLPREDSDVATAIKKDLAADNISFKLGVQIDKVVSQHGKAAVILTENGQQLSLPADKILAATGRQPATAKLGLENTAIQLTDRGAIKVDDQLQTTVPGVWALGDVKGGPQFTYISLDDFRIIKDQLYGSGKRRISNRGAVPTSVFITPPLAQVGLTEKEAQRRGQDYLLFKLPAAVIPKAKVLKEQRGLLKMLADPQSRQVLGATLYAAEAHELINMVALAMQAKLPYTMLRDQIYTHPTISEAFNDLLKAPVKSTNIKGKEEGLYSV